MNYLRAVAQSHAQNNRVNAELSVSERDIPSLTAKAFVAVLHQMRDDFSHKDAIEDPILADCQPGGISRQLTPPLRARAYIVNRNARADMLGDLPPVPDAAQLDVATFAQACAQGAGEYARLQNLQAEFVQERPNVAQTELALFDKCESEISMRCTDWQPWAWPVSVLNHADMLLLFAAGLMEAGPARAQILEGLHQTCTRPDVRASSVLRLLVYRLHSLALQPNEPSAATFRRAALCLSDLLPDNCRDLSRTSLARLAAEVFTWSQEANGTQEAAGLLRVASQLGEQLAQRCTAELTMPVLDTDPDVLWAAFAVSQRLGVGAPFPLQTGVDEQTRLALRNLFVCAHRSHGAQRRYVLTLIHNLHGTHLGHVKNASDVFNELDSIVGTVRRVASELLHAAGGGGPAAHQPQIHDSMRRVFAQLQALRQPLLTLGNLTAEYANAISGLLT